MKERHVPSGPKRTFSQGVRINPAGRIVVPAPIRTAPGIKDRQMLHMFQDDGFILQTAEAGPERIWAIAQWMEIQARA